MLTQEQRATALAAPCVALAFLCEPENRQKARNQMQGFSDPAIFHRWMSLFWTFGEAEALALLTLEEQELVSQFTTVYHSIEWTPLADHPFISDTTDDSLNRLVPVATKLLNSLRSRQHVRVRCSICPSQRDDQDLTEKLNDRKILSLQ